MEGVSATNDWLKRPPGDAADTSERQGVVEFLWGAQQGVSLHPLNNQTRSSIPLMVLPLMVADTLLHVAEPVPAPQFARALSRDSTEVNRVGLPRSRFFPAQPPLVCLPAFPRAIKLGGNAARLSLLLPVSC